MRRNGCGRGFCLVAMLVVVGVSSAAGPAADFTERPELWTCGAQDWGPNEAKLYAVSDGAAVGRHCVALNFTHGYEHYAAFPKWRNADWDLTDVAALEFQVRLPLGLKCGGANPTVYLRNQDGPFIRLRPADRRSLLDDGEGKWTTIRVPLAPDKEWERVEWLTPSLADIDFIEIAFSGTNLPGGAAHHILIDGVRFTPDQPAYDPPNEEAGDLDVLIIEREPKYERYHLPPYDGHEFPTCDNADAQHQPDAGETVTYTARVQNKGRAPLGGTYRWLLDGAEAARGDVATLAPRDEASFTWTWKWDPADHDVTFALTPAAEDYCPRNDALTIRTNALLLKFVIERGLIARMESKVNMLGSRSCEDWLQGQLAFMNQLFARSVYAFAPRGITQRVAVGKLEYVDDGWLRRTYPVGPFQVGEADISVDGGRGCTALDDPWNSGAGAPAFLNFIGRPDDAWLHELSHQIGVIDMYQFITEPGDNAVNGVGFNYRNRGLMGGGECHPHPHLGTLYSVYSPGSVHGLNATQGKRRGYFGEYLYCLPQRCGLRIVDEEGRPLAGAAVKVYQTHDRKIDAEAEHAGVTDADGVVWLANRPAGPGTTLTGCELHDNPFGAIHVVGFNGVFLVTADVGDEPRYGFACISDFNVAWSAGQRDEAVVPVQTKVKGDETWYWKPPSDLQ